MQPSVLILGASTRAAAQSAIRAGLRPICADLFTDLDLRACARVLVVADYPRGLVAAAASAPQCPWIYTGGLENHPGLVDRISETRPLWGNDGAALRRIRNPWSVWQILHDAPLPALDIWPSTAGPPPADGKWMLKPLHGAAGRGIRIWDGHPAGCGALRERHYFQERRAGAPVSALFLAAPHKTELVGITRQLVGMEAVHAPPFAWCGTITPVELAGETVVTMRAVGRRLGRAAGLQGLFGCDFLVDADGQPWLTEVNPRYPASTELVECALQIPLLEWHRRAFVDPPSGGFPDGPPAGGTTNTGRAASGSIRGKIVLYADRDLIAPDWTRFESCPAPWPHSAPASDLSLPFIADIPNPGQWIPRGQPICTVFACGRTESECLAKLLRRAARLQRQIL